MDTKSEILRVLREEFDGEVFDVEGRAARKIFEHTRNEVSYVTLSGTLQRMEKDGIIVRDMPNLKRTTRIAINGPGVRPGSKSATVIMEKASRAMAEMLEPEIQRAIDAHVDAAIANYNSEQAVVLNNEISSLKSRLLEAQREPTALKAELDQARSEIAELKEQLRIAEHNTEVWRKQALGKPKVREMLSTVRDTLDPEQTRMLDSLMRELPRG